MHLQRTLAKAAFTFPAIPKAERRFLRKPDVCCDELERRIWVESCQSRARNRHSANARQIYNSENRPGPGIADKVNAMAVPVVVQVSALQGI